MSTLDWTVVAFYLVGLVALSFYLSRGQVDHKDYYLGGRTLSWWSIGISTMATQLSAISFISAPAFVGLREGGGLEEVGIRPRSTLILAGYFVSIVALSMSLALLA